MKAKARGPKDICSEALWKIVEASLLQLIGKKTEAIDQYSSFATLPIPTDFQFFLNAQSELLKNVCEYESESTVLQRLNLTKVSSNSSFVLLIRAITSSKLTFSRSRFVAAEKAASQEGNLQIKLLALSFIAQIFFETAEIEQSMKVIEEGTKLATQLNLTLYIFFFNQLKKGNSPVPETR